MSDETTGSLHAGDTTETDGMGQSDQQGWDGNTDDQTRGNVLLAAALMLAALVVLAAASLMLAPTGSDGVTGQSGEHDDIDLLEEGLQSVFIESRDTLDDSYDPTFDPPDTDGPPPLNYTTVAELLAAQPFTDQQVVQTQNLMASLAARQVGGTVASLEPIAADTRTGTLLRLGRNQSYDFGRNRARLVGNATALRDFTLTFNRTTLPLSPDNATTLSVGNWTLAAYQRLSTNRTYYQLGNYDPAGTWNRTARGANLRVTAYDGTVTVNGKDTGAAVTPGYAPFNLTVDDGRPATGLDGTHGGLNLVAVGTGPDDVGDVSEDNWQEVVTRPAFNVTYIDASTTVTDRVTVTTEYRAFDPPERGPGLVPIRLDLDVETEDASDLRETSADDVWLPQYTAQPNLTYEMTVTATLSNGSRLSLTSAANFSFAASGTDCPDDCARVTAGNSSVYATPEELVGDLQVRASVDTGAVGTDRRETAIPRVSGGESGRLRTTAGNRTLLTRNVTVLDPYIESRLGYPNDTVYIGQSVDAGAFVQVPRHDGYDAVERPLSALDGLSSSIAPHIPFEMAGHFGLDTDAERMAVADALARLQELTASERAAFVGGNVTGQLDVLGFSQPPTAVEEFLTQFDGRKTAVTPADLVRGPRTDPTTPDSRGSHTAPVLLFHGNDTLHGVSADVSPFTIARQLHAAKDAQQRAGGGIPESELGRFYVDNTTVTSQAVVDALTDVLWEGRSNETMKSDWTRFMLKNFDAFQHRTRFSSTADSVYELSDQQLVDAYHNASSGHPTGDPWTYLPVVRDRLQEYPYDGFNHPDETPLTASHWGSFTRSHKQLYLFLGGVDYPAAFSSPLELVEPHLDLFNRSTQPTLSQTSALLAESLAPMNGDSPRILKESALAPNGTFALSDWWTDSFTGSNLVYYDDLVTDWGVALSGTYTGYGFTNYTGRDVVTVTDPVSKVVDINLSIEYEYPEKTLASRTNRSVLNLHSDVPLIVGQERDITTTVTFANGTTRTNPSFPFVNYNLTGPSVTPYPCNRPPTAPGTCWEPLAPMATTPEEFATLNTTEMTITAHNETGTLQLDTTKNPGLKRSGPIEVVATTVDGTQTAHLNTSAVGVEIDGYAEWAYGKGVLNRDAAHLYVLGVLNQTPNGQWENHTAAGSPIQAPVEYGIEYTLRHSQFKLDRNWVWRNSTKEPVTQPPTNGTEVRGTPKDLATPSNMTGSEMITVDFSPNSPYGYTTLVKSATSNESIVYPDDSDVVMHNIPEAAALGISWALGRSTEQGDNPVYNGTARFTMKGGTNNNDGGGGGGGGSSDWDVLASQQSNGRLNFAGSITPGTTKWNEQFEVNETVNPNTDRFDILQNNVLGGDIVDEQYTYELKAGEPSTENVYVWSNAEAVKANGTDLINGSVRWRNKSGCGSLGSNSSGGCLEDPAGLVDYLDTSDTEQWTSQLTAKATNNDRPVNFYVESGTGGPVVSSGRHTHTDFVVNVTSTDPNSSVPPGTYTGVLLVDAFHDGFTIDGTSAKDKMPLEVTVKKGDDDQPNP